MGQFSWYTCDTLNPIINNEEKTVYLLNPFGENFKETCYDGSGNFDGRDVYELVAEWNKGWLDVDLIKKPRLESYGETEYFENAMKHYEKKVQRLLDFKNGKSENEMADKYGTYWKREIGIDIACYDYQNFSLPFPIQIASSDIPYSMGKPSISDPAQGGWSTKREIQEVRKDFYEYLEKYYYAVRKSEVHSKTDILMRESLSQEENELPIDKDSAYLIDALYTAKDYIENSLVPSIDECIDAIKELSVYKSLGSVEEIRDALADRKGIDDSKDVDENNDEYDLGL